MRESPDEPDEIDQDEGQEDQSLNELLRETADRFPDPLARGDALNESMKRIAQRTRAAKTEIGPPEIDSMWPLARRSSSPSSQATRLLHVVTTAAATIIVTTGLVAWYVYRSTGPGEVLACNIEPVHETLRDGSMESVGRTPSGSYTIRNDWTMVIRSPRNGFATIVLASPHAVTLRPRANEEPIEVQKLVPVLDGPLRAIDGRTNVIVVVTQSPSTELIRNVVAAGVQSDAAGMKERILQKLWREGHRWVSVGTCDIEPTEREQDPLDN